MKMNSLYFLIIHYETVLTNCHLNIVIFESFKSTRNDTKLMEASHIVYGYLWWKDSFHGFLVKTAFSSFTACFLMGRGTCHKRLT